jgi:hypothetical protein
LRRAITRPAQDEDCQLDVRGQAAVDVEWLAGGAEEFGSLTQAASGDRLVAFRAIPDS